MRISLRARVAFACWALVMVSGVVVVLLVGVLAPRFLKERNDANRPAVPPAAPPGAPAPGSPGAATRQRAEDAARKAAADETFDDIRTVGFVTVAGLSVVAVGVAWVVAGRIVRPVRLMTEATRDISSDTRLDRRLALDGPQDELHDLAVSFDEMLDRLQSVFEAQRSFTANASHELRTPLAVMQTEVDVALDATHDGTSDDARQLREALGAVGEELGRTTAVVDAMLALSRADTLATVQPADLAELVQASVDRLSPIERGRHDVQLDLAAAPLRGDPVLLARLVDNLVTNAIRYNRLEGLVRVTTGTTAGGVRLLVENDGPLVDPDSVPALFTRFVRRSEMGDGHGVGLSIVDAVTRTHGGTCTATPRTQGGLAVEVTLPVRTS